MMTSKLRVFGISIMLLGVLLFAGPAVVMAASPQKPHLPPTWNETPTAKGNSAGEGKWVDDEYYGNCRDKNNTIQCGDVWHKDYGNGRRSNPYLDKQILCAGVAAQGCPVRSKLKERQKNLDQYQQ